MDYQATRTDQPKTSAVPYNRPGNQNANVPVSRELSVLELSLHDLVSTNQILVVTIDNLVDRLGPIMRACGPCAGENLKPVESGVAIPDAINVQSRYVQLQTERLQEIISRLAI